MILGMIGELAPHLAADDAVIDGGDSFHHDDIRRAKTLPDIVEAWRPGNQLDGPDERP